jgi:hypothetical protein
MPHFIQRIARMAVLFAVLTTAFPAGQARAAGEVAGEQATWASIPMTLDFGLLNALVTQSAFAPGQEQTVLLRQEDGCQGLAVSAPRFFAEQDQLFFEMRIQVRHGLDVGNLCLLPVSFEGFLVMRKHPEIDPMTWKLRFATQSSRILDRNRQPARLATLAWRMVQDSVLPHQESMQVDLGPPVKNLQEFLPLVMSAQQPQAVLEMVASLRPASINVRHGGLRLDNEIRVPREMYRDQTPEISLSRDELDAFTTVWEAWDAFMVSLITRLAGEELAPDEQLLLLDLLLRLRHGFLEELAEEAPDRDLVRLQFMQAWEELEPLFRARLLNTRTDSLLGYLAFFSATDALRALDKLGPALGLEISRDGLLRLARWLADDPEMLLEYGAEEDNHLRRILGLEPEEEHAAPQLQPLSSRQGPGLGQTARKLLGLLRPDTAWADTPSAETHSAAQKWLFQHGELDSYLQRVTQLLRNAADTALDTQKAGDVDPGFYEDMILATAWQESCFRQFVSKQGRASVLRSYNNTSVGLMQINERVWRGLYDQQRLRWDIAYNARAGSEIILLYLTRYALPTIQRTPELDWNQDGQARLVYALYNGGPAQKDTFPRRWAEKDFRASDRLFHEKWNWVRADDLNKVSVCLVGG